jgi:hypothetical protein
LVNFGNFLDGKQMYLGFENGMLAALVKNYDGNKSDFE